MVKTTAEDLGISREFAGYKRERDDTIVGLLNEGCEEWNANPIKPATIGKKKAQNTRSIGHYLMHKLKDAGYEIRVRPGAGIDDAAQGTKVMA